MTRRHRDALLVVYALAMGWILLSPVPSAGSTGVELVTDVFRRLGVPTDAGTARLVEIGLNVVLFVPLPLLAHHRRPAWRVSGWTLAGALLAVGVETVQLLMLPARSGDPVDVVANAAGCAVGAAIGGMAWGRFPAGRATADLGWRS